MGIYNMGLLKYNL